jgi:hypothetical protein
VDADPVRNGFHSPKCLWEKVPYGKEATIPQLWPLQTQVKVLAFTEKKSFIT